MDFKAVMSSDEDLSSHTRPYTVGFSIAAFLIFFIVIVHLSRFIFRKVAKCLNDDQVEVIITETPVKQNDGRKLSTNCVQQLELILRVNDEVSGIDLRQTQRREIIARSNTEHLTTQKKRSTNRNRHSTVHQNRKHKREQPYEITFLAGYSHKHIND